MAAKPACSNLKVSLRDGGIYNANTYTLIDFTNESGAACILKGIPALDLLTASGLPFKTIWQTPGSPQATAVTLAPGATANARITVSGDAAKNFPAAQCKPETSAYVGVEPGSTVPVHIPFKVSVCTTSYVSTVSVAPFAPGTGTYIHG